MSFVGDPFKHDIFVSYSHGDVRGDGEALLKQWSQGFVAELERELQAFPEVGAKISVFLDEHFRPGRGLDPLAPLSDTLKSEINASAVLAILMTPQYLASRWCRHELDWWVEAQGRYELPHQDRIAVARVWPTGDAQWPAPLVDKAGHQHVGHHFYDRSRAETRPQPFAWPVVNHSTTGPLRDALLDLVGSILIRLRQVAKHLEERRRREADQARRKAIGGQVLYLHGRNAHASQWERVNRELEDEGYTVFPLEPERIETDPKKNLANQNERISTMSACDGVLLLGTDDVPALVTDLVTVGRQDRYHAVARSNKKLPCGVVDTCGMVRQNTAWLRKARSLGLDWFDASITPWTPQIQSWFHGALE